jgi:4-azaleucine resistance transporter AzlC
MADAPSGSTRLRDGFRAGAPLAPAPFAFGVAFGVLAQSAGMGVAAPIVMSATTFAGSAQFAAASVLDDNGGVVAAIVAAVLLNARYGPMSIAVAPLFEGSFVRRLVTAQLIVDESWALAARGPGRFDPGVLLGVGLLFYPLWVGGTAVGAIAGDVVGDPERLGLDAAFPALFLALLVPQVRSRTALAAALLGAATALALLPLTAPGVPIIAASGACLLGLLRR